MPNSPISPIFSLINSMSDEQSLIGEMKKRHFLNEIYAKAKDEVGRTALHILASKGYANAAHELLQVGAVADAPSQFGTPIECSIKGKHLNVTKILLEHPINFRQVDKQYFTPLHWAAQIDDADLALTFVQLLTKAGADVNIVGGNREWPLHIAIKRGDEALVKALLSDKVLNAKSAGGKTALQLAYEHGHETIAKLILDKGADINCDHGQDGKKLIEWAAEQKKDMLVDMLFEKGADVKHCYSLLFWACKHDRVDIVEKMLAVTLGASLNHGVNRVSAQGWTALEYAAFSGSLDSVKVLIKHKANIHHQDKFGHSALELAAYNGHTAIVELLVASGAKVDIQDAKGYTPLMEAIKQNHSDTVRALQNLGADWNVHDAKEWTAYHWVQHTNHLPSDGFTMPSDIALGCMDTAPSNDHLDVIHAAFERGEW